MGKNTTNEQKKIGKKLQLILNKLGFPNDLNHLKKCSATSVIREIQIKNTMKYTRKLEQKNLTMSNVGEEVEQQEPKCTSREV